jgi:hypothetical protein
MQAFSHEDASTPRCGCSAGVAWTVATIRLRLAFCLR